MIFPTQAVNLFYINVKHSFKLSFTMKHDIVDAKNLLDSRDKLKTSCSGWIIHIQTDYINMHVHVRQSSLHILLPIMAFHKHVEKDFQ